MSFETPKTSQTILSELQALRRTDPPTHGGRVLSYVYDSGIEGLDDLMAEAATAFLPVNGLDPTTFTSVAVLERDVVAFARQITSGDGDVVGSVTSGGTESILLAVKSARDVWRASHGSATRPALVAPTTAHAAFHKACAYFDLTMVPVDVDPETGTVDAEEYVAVVDGLREAGTPPALVVLSAPNYPLGGIDDIATIAPQMAERGVPVHVDACVGGFVLPFYPREVPAWDFSVAGVRSISLDAHKYGFAPKGASIVLYRGREYHQAQYFATVDWPGYPVVNPTLLGSRSATALAAAWAVIQRLGREGYSRAVARTVQATDVVRATLAAVPGLKVIGDPFGPLIAVANDGTEQGVDPYRFVDALKKHGFLAQAQPAFRDIPRSAHFTLTPVTDDVAQELSEAIVRAAAEVSGMRAPEPNPALLEEVAANGLPEEQAEVMATLETLPDDVATGALIGLLARVIDPGE